MLNFIRSLRKKRAERIIDRSHMRTAPERAPMHAIFCALYAIATFSVLWQHCHPYISILILALIAPISLAAWVPYSKFSLNKRFILQLILICTAVLWAYYRFRTGELADKVCLELVGLAGLTFLMGRRSRDYCFIFVISAFLLFYGALLPRVFFLGLFAGAAVCILLIFYAGRNISLSGDASVKPTERRLKRTWVFYVTHALLTFFFAACIFLFLPKLPYNTEGAFEVSFFTDKDSFVPLSMQKWLHNEKKETRFKADAGIIDKTLKPKLVDPGKGTPMEIRKASANSNANGGGTAAMQGKDLLFTVKSPLKLYHIARVYNQYDGSAWHFQLPVKYTGVRRLHSDEREPVSSDIEISYTICKWITPRLFAPYLPVFFSRQDNAFIVNRRELFTAELPDPKDNYPALPFRYNATVRVFLPQNDVPVLPHLPSTRKYTIYWLERAPKYIYRALPKRKISKRLTNLVEELTKDKTNDYEKALALRDYLRNNFPYVLNAAPLPKGKETADYFIFELKTGHCEYFATTLAVMARIAGIPSRIATGFSPGNYNTLTTQFEVYEYHAHAWTQIFIEGYGWLTFDATPPQNIISRTTPTGIGTLRDPFGDEWKIKPPELAEEVQNRAKKIYVDQMGKETMLNRIENAVSDALARQAVKDAEAGSKGKRTLAAAVRDFLSGTKTGLKQSMLQVKTLMRNGFQPCHIWILLLIPAAILLKIVISATLRKRLQRKAMRCFEAAGNADLAPEHQIRALYKGTRLLLKSAGLPRRRNRELMDYALSLEPVSPRLAWAAGEIFGWFYQIEYGGTIPEEFSPENAEAHIRTLLAELTKKDGDWQ